LRAICLYELFQTEWENIDSAWSYDYLTIGLENILVNLPSELKGIRFFFQIENNNKK
jgi:hypothetical protein